MTPRTLQRSRAWVQALSFVLFLGGLLWMGANSRPVLPADLLLRLDPLAALASMLASRQWLARFVPGLLVLAATLLLGRAWCGWLCPLGTLIDWTSPRRSRGDWPERWRAAKYALLFTLLFAALWGNLTLLILDPLTLFVRAVSTLLAPALNWLISRAELALYPIRFLQGPLDVVDGALRGTLLAFSQPHYGGWLLALVLGGILALNLTARRAWCRYLCPLGGLFSLVARAALLRRRVSDECVACSACARNCRMGTIDARKNYASDSGECVLCMDCVADCPADAIAFRRAVSVDRGHAYDPSRRQLFGALGASLGGLALLKVTPRAHHAHSYRVRPPGAEEDTLLARCIRCGACVRVCPTHGLQPSLAEAGLEGLWTPVLVPRLGQCDYSCTACGETCPTGAIPALDLATKRLTPLGKASIDTQLCLPWSGRADCIVCEEMCPLPQKAIVLEEVTHADADTGEILTRLAPVVLHERCIGCGLCEQKCPVQGEAAIRVIVDPLG
ncbi:MAG: 4Fe-4S binding protein [Chloroflexi bacterium]|nr:4Fe-4S binding protein [Chloroflexota bacterium]